MYAVINSGGKQARVAVGETLEVERLKNEAGDEVRMTPLLLVDGEKVVTDAAALGKATVVAKVIGEVKGPKINGFTYKPKSRQQRHYGHRQRYTAIEITSIETAAPRAAKG